MKAKLSLLTILLAFSTSGFAGKSDNSDDYKSFKRLYVGFFVTPNVSYRYLHQNFVPSGYSDAQVQSLINTRNNYEYPEVGAAGGLKVGIRLTHWLAIESGVSLTWQKYRFASTNPLNQPGWAPGNPIDSFATAEHNTYWYFNIPLALNFTAGKHKVRGIFSLGTTFDFLLQKRITYTYTYSNGTTASGHETDKYDNFNTFNLSPFLGIGMDCYLGKVVVLRIMPVAQIQALKNINAPVTEYLYNAGINVSLLFGMFNNK